MRIIKNPLEIINSMMSENDKILFNLFYLIADSENSFWATDDRSYIIGQTNEKLPMWIWISDAADEDAKSEVEAIIEERLKPNSGLRVTADENKITDILERLSKRLNVKFKASVPMVIYQCGRVNKLENIDGRVILSSDEHKDILKEFITGMVYDLEKRPVAEGEAEGFAASTAGSPDLFLWEEEGTVVSMAMIVHRTEKYARINTVYTDKNQRGKGYAGMLMAEITQRILDEGRTPVLYTEQDNVCSNALYQKTGYNICGELVQYSLHRY